MQPTCARVLPHAPEPLRRRLAIGTDGVAVRAWPGPDGAEAPFGAIVKGDAQSTVNPFQFVGAYGVRWEPQVGLYHMGARFYDPTIGRFLSRDPLPGIISTPITLNRYVYSRNNPLGFIDPEGQIAYPQSDSCSGIIRDALKLASARIQKAPKDCINEFKKHGCGDIQNLITSSGGPPFLFVGNIGAYGMTDPSPPHRITVNRNICTRPNRQEATFLMAATIAHEMGHWCALQRRGGVLDPSHAFTEQGECVERLCFGRLVGR